MTLLIDELLKYRGALTLSERMDLYEQEAARRRLIEERRAERESRRENVKKFTGEPPTDWGSFDHAASEPSSAAPERDLA